MKFGSSLAWLVAITAAVGIVMPHPQPTGGDANGKAEVASFEYNRVVSAPRDHVYAGLAQDLLGFVRGAEANAAVNADLTHNNDGSIALVMRNPDGSRINYLLSVTPDGDDAALLAAQVKAKGLRDRSAAQFEEEVRTNFDGLAGRIEDAKYAEPTAPAD